jgi:RNA polymerase sigma factor (TIGR02999 family)
MAETQEGDITRLVLAVNTDKGDEIAVNRLFESIYPHLRIMARRHLSDRRKGQTLDSVALVGDAYIKLMKIAQVRATNRAQFFALLSVMMQNSVYDYARTKKRKKRGSGTRPVSLQDVMNQLPEEDSEEHLALGELLQQYEAMDALGARVVRLRFFHGFNSEEIAGKLGINVSKVHRLWYAARDWMLDQLEEPV